MDEGNRGDDMFANSSTETVIQNIDFSVILREAACSQREELSASGYSEADPSYKAECFVSEVCNFALQLHCPFCCKYFAFEYMLKEHIKAEHEKYWDMLRSDDHVLLLHSCLFCHAKYYKKHVLLKHILYSHQEVVIAASHKHQLCAFCPYTTVAPSRSKLLYHIEQKHAKEFETLVDGMYIHNAQLDNTMASSQHSFASFQHSHADSKPSTNYGTPVCEVIENAQVLSPIPKRSRSARKRLRFDEERCQNIPNSCSRASKWKTFFSFMNLKKQNDAMVPKITTSTPKPPSDRRSLVDNDICYFDYNAGKKLKETSFNRIQKKGFSLNIFSKRKNKYQSFSEKRPKETGVIATKMFKKQPSIRKPACGNKNVANTGDNGIELSCRWAANDEYRIKQFKCAVCLEAFGDNVGLVCHAKRHHNGPLRLLHPSFKCGLCDATFYKNSFLLRHCKFHHTPLCLRS